MVYTDDETIQSAYQKGLQGQDGGVDDSLSKLFELRKQLRNQKKNARPRLTLLDDAITTLEDFKPEPEQFWTAMKKDDVLIDQKQQQLQGRFLIESII